MPLARRSSRTNANARQATRNSTKKAAPKAAKTAAKAAKPALKLSGDITTKTELFDAIAQQCELSRKKVKEMFECIDTIVSHQMKKSSSGVFTIPGICKILVQEKPAVAARKGINPFTGEPTVFKAKPRRRVVKIRALKHLKDMVKG